MRTIHFERAGKAVQYQKRIQSGYRQQFAGHRQSPTRRTLRTACQAATGRAITGHSPDARRRAAAAADVRARRDHGGVRADQEATACRTAQPLNDMVRRAAMLGGFLARKRDGEPGVKTIQVGLQRVLDFTADVRFMGDSASSASCM